MNEVMGIAWFKDDDTYRKALSVFCDPENMPASFDEWKAIMERQCELIRYSGDIPIRADIDPESFAIWCASRGLLANSEGRIAFAKHAEIEYRKTGKGTVIE